jgi:hypothetical protein
MSQTVKPAPSQPTTTPQPCVMPFSEALRIGAMNRPQGSCRFLTDAGRTCAIGAALDAVGAFDHNARPSSLELTHKAEQLWPYLVSHTRGPLDDAGAPRRLIDIIMRLNDHNFWTREQIAEWVATIEPSVSTPG